jgi:DNA (cytosine-5)-methyltransferase 1
LSVAGKRAGLAGARSGLWWHVVRLLQETQARWFLGENVPGLLSSNDGQDFHAVCDSLGQLGYGYAARVLDAQWFGVPQRRRRVFIVGHLGEPWPAPAEVLFECEGGAGDSAAGGEAGPGVAAGSAHGAGVLSYTRVAHGEYAPGVGTLQAKGGDCGGGSESLITTTVSTLQGGGRRGYRIDAESASGGHLIVGGGRVDR